jgi:surfactin synthase thioesterase subunit
MPEFEDITTWTEHLGHSRLCSFTDGVGHFWLEQKQRQGIEIGEARQGWSSGRMGVR